MRISDWSSDVCSSDLANRFSPGTCPRLIVKVGSALLVSPEGEVHAEWVETLVADIAGRAQAGQQVAIVSSGAIALGARRLELPGGGRNRDRKSTRLNSSH